MTRQSTSWQNHLATSLTLASLACSPSSASTKAQSASVPVAAPIQSGAASASPASASPAPAPPAAESPVAPPTESPGMPFTRAPTTRPALLLTAHPVSQIAAGKHRIAAIVSPKDEVPTLLVFELSGNPSKPQTRPKVVAEVPLPEAVRLLPSTLQLFLGRDDWPRLIVVPREASDSPTYYRFRPNQGWQSPKDEQGALATTGSAAGYYGVLGHEDPEVLCVPGLACYEKRVEGWSKRSVPGAGSWLVTLTPDPAQPRKMEAWAWAHAPGIGVVFQRLNSAWSAALPALDVPVHAFAHWSQGYLAMTTDTLFRLDQAPSEPPAKTQPAPDSAAPPVQAEPVTPSWRPLTSIRGGRTLLRGPEDTVLIGSAEGLHTLSGPEAPPTPIYFIVDGAPPQPAGDVRCLQATVASPIRYAAGSDAGLFLFDAPGAL